MSNINNSESHVPSVFSNSEFGSVRVITREDGEPLFCLKDVATCLGYSDQAQAVRDHVDSEDKGVVEITTHGCKQDVTFITESGLYSLILGSKLESAKKFKRWVTSEVLPSIRKASPVQEITVVNFLGEDIRVLGTPENPLFIAADVCPMEELFF